MVNGISHCHYSEVDIDGPTRAEEDKCPRPGGDNEWPHFMKEVRCMGVPLITVGTSAESYKLPGSRSNPYLMLSRFVLSQGQGGIQSYA